MVVAMRHFSFYPKIFEKNFFSPYDFTLFWGVRHGSPDFFTSSNCRRSKKIRMRVAYGGGYAAFWFLPGKLQKKNLSPYDFALFWGARHISPDYFTSSNCRRSTKLGMCVPYSCACAAIWFLLENY